MTALEIELKKKKRSDRHFQWARVELETIQETYSRKKVDIIHELASKLDEEGEIETKRISTEIAERLKKHVSQRYVNKVLDERYKDESHIESAKSRRTSSAKTKRVTQALNIPEADIIAENELHGQEVTAGKLLEHDDWEALALENSELKQALKRQTTLQSPEQIFANEITYIVRVEKFNQLTDVMEISRDFIRLVFDKSGFLERAESDIF